MAERPFITCHVLDTTTGKPGAGIAVTLQLMEGGELADTIWEATTNEDGRVVSWGVGRGSADLNEVIAQWKKGMDYGDQTVWCLKFDTEVYFGKGNTFWPQVQLIFAAKKEEQHYHVPLLLGPWSYTTYRGS